MTILALDTALGLALALKTDAKTYVYSIDTARSSDLLPTELQKILTESGTTAADVSAIFVTTGPGSFTGIRLGLATAEALHLLNPSLQIHGLSTLQALAAQVVATHSPAGNFILALDAAGQQIYTQTFTPAGQSVNEATCVPVSEVFNKPNVFASPSLLLDAPALPALDPEILLTLAANPQNHLPAEPVYLKPLTYKQVS